MKFPSIEQYGEAMQFPANTILDPKLNLGRVQTDTLGLPWGRSGAFALTFKVSSQGANFAFRCFQSQRDSMHERYESISKFLSKKTINGFVNFRYLDEGIRIQKVNYPVVIMDWASGQSLGSYIEENLQNKGTLTVLQKNLEKLALELEAAGIAHGDIQSQNILVNTTGELALVDYDGVFVPALAKLTAIESGHRNFQHPQREKLLPFDSTLDRFPFALLHTSIGAIIEDPALWDEFKCHPEKILFSSDDLQNPGKSKIFKKLAQNSQIKKRSTQLAAFAQARYDQTPTFTEYLQGEKPQVPVEKTQPAGAASQPWYMNPEAPIENQASTPIPSNLIVVDARKTDDLIANEKQQVQLVGKIIQVDIGTISKGMPHVILTLLSSNSLKVDVAIWGEGLKAFANSGITVDETWTNEWIAVDGELSSKLGSSAGPYIRLTVTRPEQVERISHQKATYLIKNGSQSLSSGSQTEEETVTRNEDLISSLGSPESFDEGFWGRSSNTSTTATTNQSSASTTKKILFNNKNLRIPILVGCFLLIALVITAIIASYESTSDGANPSDTEVTNNLDATELPTPLEDYEGACLTDTNDIVDCSDPSAMKEVVSTSDPSRRCPITLNALRRPGGWVCTTPLEMDITTTIAVETCFEADFDEGPVKECFPGETWKYEYCWGGGRGAVLQQKIRGSWETVKSDIASNNDCMPDYPWTISFSRQASGVGAKDYRILIPETDEVYEATQFIQVTVKAV